jgi:hypothetical protein
MEAASQSENHRSLTDPAVKELLRSVMRIGSTAAGSDEKKSYMLAQLKSSIVRHGCPIIFITINPGERHSPLALYYAGEDIDIKHFYPEWFTATHRRHTMLRNPLAVIEYFHNTVKAINNMMACVNSLAMMEGVALGVKAGLDPMTVYEVVKASSGGSKALERIPSAIVPRNFEPGFKVRLMNKDLETFNTIAKELHVPVSFSNVAQRYQQAAMAAGLADMDTSVAMTIIERLAAIEAPRAKA